MLEELTLRSSSGTAVAQHSSPTSEFLTFSVEMKMWVLKDQSNNTVPGYLDIFYFTLEF